MTTATAYEHIAVDSDAGAIISGTAMKVVELVLDHLAYGWSPEELHFQHPRLSLGEIHSALAYYWDHKDEMDDEVAQRLNRVRELRQAARPCELQRKLQRGR